MKYKIITPAGFIIVDTADEAEEYKRLYGYPYVRINDNQED